MNRLQTIRALGQHFGWRWLVLRVAYALRLRSGLMRRQLPATTWDTYSLDTLFERQAFADPDIYLIYRRETARKFFFDGREQLRPVLATYPFPAVDALLAGKLTYFSAKSADIGSPPRWHANPFTQTTLPNHQHWSEISDFASGDIKVIWEPSRFGWVYTLVRAYWRTGDERYANTFWQWLEDWWLQNPPQQGANWKCGQETSLRVMATCFGIYGFLDSPATTGKRLLAVARMMSISAQRILANINYALRQRNNHGMSEGMGLWTIGLLFPELRGAEKWRQRGREILIVQADELIAPDGSFAQQSVNYHRVMLDNYVWALRLGEIFDQPFDTGTIERIRQAGLWLYQLLDDETGLAPIYGQNDGAQILPLSGCEYGDYRPITQAIHYLTDRKKLFHAGGWDEKLHWLFGADAHTAPKASILKRDFSAPDGGYFIFRDTHSKLFTRCTEIVERPSHADMLHVSFWWKGQPIAVDAGTYSYNAPRIWNNPLAHTRFHNTVTVNGKDQMTRSGKFLWLPWLKGAVTCHESPFYWEGTHDGFAHVSYRRAILKLGHDRWLVLDRLVAPELIDVRLHWLLADLPHQQETAGTLRLTLSAGDFYVQTGMLDAEPTISLVRADANSAEGWRSTHYMERKAALAFSVEHSASKHLFWTLFTPNVTKIISGSDRLCVNDSELWLSTDTTQPIVKQYNHLGIINNPCEHS